MDKRKKYWLYLALLILLVGRFYLVGTTNRIFERPKSQFCLYPDRLIDKMLQIFSLLSTLDLTVIFFCVVATLFILFIELKKSAFSQMLSYVLERPHLLFATLLYLGIFTAAPYFSSGIPYRSDGSQHLFWSWVASNAASHAKLTLWSNYYWGGIPFLRYYGFLFYYLVGAVNLAFQNILFSLKFTLALFHILSGFFMYLLLFRLSKERLASLLGTIAYLFIYFRFFWILEMGKLRYCVFFAALPLIWYLTEQFFENQRRKTLIYLGFCFAFLILVQPGNYSVHTLIFFLWYIILRLFCLKGVSSVRKIKTLLSLSGSFLIGLSLSSWLILPSFLEARKDLEFFLKENCNLSSPSFFTLFKWTPNPWPNNYASYLGISIILIAGLGIVSTLRKKNTQGLIFSFLTVLSIFLATGPQIKLYKFYPFVFAHPSMGYFMLFAVFFLCAVSCYGSSYILNFFSQKAYYKAGLVILFLLLADLAPLTFQDFLPDRLPHGRDTPYAWLASQANKNQRVLDIGQDLELKSALLPVATGFRVINGCDYKLGMPDSRKHINELVFFLTQKQLFNQKEIEFLKSALYAMDIRYIVMDEVISGGDLFKRVIRFADKNYIGELERYTPILASSGLQVVQSASLRQNILGADIDSQHNSCQKLFVLSRGTPPLNNKDSVLEKMPYLELISYKVDNDSMVAEFIVDQPSFVQVAQSYYPNLEVTVDGRPVKDILETALGLVSFSVSAGRHNVLVRKPHFSTLRKTMVGFSSATFLACCAVLAKDNPRC